MEKYMSKNYMSYKEAALKDWYLVHTRDDMKDPEGMRLVKISFGNGKTYTYESAFWREVSEDDVVVMRNNYIGENGSEEMGRFKGRVTEDETDANVQKEIKDTVVSGEIWHDYKVAIPGDDECGPEVWSKYNYIAGSDIKDIMCRMCDNMIAVSPVYYDFGAELTIVEDTITDVILYSNVLAFRDWFDVDIVKGAETQLSEPCRLCTDIFDTKFTNMLRMIQSNGMNAFYKRDALSEAIDTWDGHDDNYTNDFKEYEDDYYDGEDEDEAYHRFFFAGCYPGWRDQLQSLSIWDKLGEYGEYIDFDIDEGVTIIKGNKEVAALFREDKEFCDFYNELVYRSAISLLIRGGFVNLLKALLSAKPPIDGFIDKLCDFAKKLGSTYCLDVLEKYKSGDENGLKTDLATTEAEKFVYSELAKITPDDKRELFRKILTGWHVAAVEKVDKIDFNGKLFCMPGRNPLMIRNCVSSRGGTYTYELRSSADYVIVDTDTLSNYHNCHKAWEWKFDGRTEWIRIISLKQFYEMCGVTPSESTGDIKPRTEMTISEFFEKRLPELLVEARREELSDSDYRSNRLTNLIGRIPYLKQGDSIIVDSVENYEPFLPDPKEYTQKQINSIVRSITNYKAKYIEELKNVDSSEILNNKDKFDQIDRIEIKHKMFQMAHCDNSIIGKYIMMNGGVCDYYDISYQYTDYLVLHELPDCRGYRKALGLRENGKNKSLKIISFLQFCDLCGIGADSPIVPDPVEMQNKDEKKSAPVTPTPESAPISEEPTCDEPSAEEENEPAPEPAAEPVPETEVPCDPESSMTPVDAEGEPLSASGMSFTEALGTEWFVVTPAGKKFRKQCIVFPDGRRCEFNTQYDHTPEDVVVIGGDGKYFGMIGRPDFSGAPVTEYDTDGRVRFVFRGGLNEETTKKMSKSIIVDAFKTENFLKRHASGCTAGKDVDLDIMNDMIANMLFASGVQAGREFVSEKLLQKSHEVLLHCNCFDLPYKTDLDDVNSQMGGKGSKKIGIVYDFKGYFPGWEKFLDHTNLWSKFSECRGCESVPGRLRFTEITKKSLMLSFDETFRNFSNELVRMSALSIMIRCGFVNLLCGALWARDKWSCGNGTIAPYIDDLCELARNTGSVYCLELLEAFRNDNEKENNLFKKVSSAKRAARALGVDWEKLFEKKMNEKRLKGVEFVNESDLLIQYTFCVAGFDEKTTKKIEEYLIRNGHEIEVPEDVHMMFMDYLVINEYAEKIPEEYDMWLKRKNEGYTHLPKVISLETICDMFGWDLDCYWEI